MHGDGGKHAEENGQPQLLRGKASRLRLPIYRPVEPPGQCLLPPAGALVASQAQRVHPAVPSAGAAPAAAQARRVLPPVPAIRRAAADAAAAAAAASLPRRADGRRPLPGGTAAAAAAAGPRRLRAAGVPRVARPVLQRRTAAAAAGGASAAPPALHSARPVRAPGGLLRQAPSIAPRGFPSTFPVVDDVKIACFAACTILCK